MTMDCLIVGAGPAGLQAGYLMHKRGLDVHILERGNVGQFFRQFPRHRTLISINKVSTGLSNPQAKLRYDWNSLLNDEGRLFTDRTRKYFPSADDYVDYLEAFAGPMSDNITSGVEVTRISKTDGVFAVQCSDGQTHHARTVIVATGVSKIWEPEIEGFDLVEQYYDYDVTPERFRDKRVLILGKGNSAFETADSLVDEAQAIHVMSPNPVKFAWQTHFVGHLRAVNNNFLDTYQLKSQNAVIDAAATKIEKTGDVYTVHAKMTAAQGHDIILQYDHVIACTGFRFDHSIFAEDIRPKLRHMDKFPAMTEQWESEETPGLFFAGTIMQCRDFKKTMSGFVHGFRHNVACLAHFVEGRLRGTAYPSDVVSLDAADMTARIVERISTGSGVFLQPGFLGDVIVLDGPEAGRHFQDVPVAWAAQEMGAHRYLQITLEFGDFGSNSMHVRREHTVDGDKADPFIHPVLRLIENGETRVLTHLSDHLDGDWRAQAAKDAGAGTVLRMTYADAGETLAPSDAALRQIAAFMARAGLGIAEKTATATAAE